MKNSIRERHYAANLVAITTINKEAEWYCCSIPIAIGPRQSTTKRISKAGYLNKLEIQKLVKEFQLKFLLIKFSA